MKDEGYLEIKIAGEGISCFFNGSSLLISTAIAVLMVRDSNVREMLNTAVQIYMEDRDMIEKATGPAMSTPIPRPSSKDIN